MKLLRRKDNLNYIKHPKKWPTDHLLQSILSKRFFQIFVLYIFENKYLISKLFYKHFEHRCPIELNTIFCLHINISLSINKFNCVNQEIKISFVLKSKLCTVNKAFLLCIFSLYINELGTCWSIEEIINCLSMVQRIICLSMR